MCSREDAYGTWCAERIVRGERETRAQWRLMDEQCVATCREQQDDSSRGRVQQVVEEEPHRMYGLKNELEPAGGEKHEGKNTDSVEEIPRAALHPQRIRTQGSEQRNAPCSFAKLTTCVSLYRSPEHPA